MSLRDFCKAVCNPICVVGLSLCLLSLGCDKSATSGGGESAATSGGSELKLIGGEVAIDGSSTVFPISQRAAELFKEEYPNINVTVGKSGTGGGFKKFTAGETDISDASRPIKSSEYELCKENKVGFIEMPVAYDGLSIVIHKSNDFATELTIDQLKKIFLKEGGAKTWKDVNADWPDLEIKIFAPGTDSGTFDYFFGDVVAKDEENEHVRDDMSLSEEDNVLVKGVSEEKGGIGFFGASYYFNNQDTIKAVSIVNPANGKAVAPTPETIESGEYAPFSRPLFIYVKESAIKRPEVKQFVKFYMKNAGTMAKDVDYVALPQDVYDLATEHFESRMTGTHFLTAEMEKRTGALTEVYTTENILDFE